MINAFTEYSDRRVWVLDGFTIDRLCLDYRFTIQVSGTAGDLNIAVSAPFVFRSNDHEQRLDPEEGSGLGPILVLLHKRAVSLTIFRNGDLSVKAESNIEVFVEKDWQYESWETTGEGVFKDIGMLCSPHEGPPWRDP